MEEWIKDNAYECEICGLIFVVYVLNDEPSTDFCPRCGSQGVICYKGARKCQTTVDSK